MIPSPLLAFLLGLAVVVFLLVGLRLPAVVGLTLATLVVGLATPEVPAAEVPAEMASAFGDVMTAVGIPILMASIIGKSLMASGAAERIVRAFLARTGEDRAEVALLGSSYVLSIPVFVDNVFYLLAPLGRSMYARTGTKYPLYVAVLSAGALATHMLVPPTPGPLAMAETFRTWSAVNTVMALTGLVVVLLLSVLVPLS